MEQLLGGSLTNMHGCSVTKSASCVSGFLSVHCGHDSDLDTDYSMQCLSALLSFVAIENVSCELQLTAVVLQKGAPLDET